MSTPLVRRSEAALQQTIDWNRIWHLKGPSRYNFFLWQLCQNCLLVNSFLAYRHISSSSLCQICYEREETPLHAIRDCAWPRRIWEQALEPPQWETFFDPSDAQAWVMSNVTPSSRTSALAKQWPYLFREIAYGIWYWRNKLLHSPDVVHPPSQVFLSTAVKRSRDLRLAWAIDID